MDKTLLDGDEALLKAYHRGDPAALEDFFWDRVEKVYQWIETGFVAGKPTQRVAPVADADEQNRLLKEVFAAVFRPEQRHQAQSETPYGPIFEKFVKTKLILLGRDAGRVQPVSGPLAEDALVAQTTDSHTQEGQWHANVSKAETFVRDLPAEEQAFIKRRFWQEMGRAAQSAREERKDRERERKVAGKLALALGVSLPVAARLLVGQNRLSGFEKRAIINKAIPGAGVSKTITAKRAMISLGVLAVAGVAVAVTLASFGARYAELSSDPADHGIEIPPPANEPSKEVLRLAASDIRVHCDYKGKLGLCKRGGTLRLVLQGAPEESHLAVALYQGRKFKRWLAHGTTEAATIEATQAGRLEAFSAGIQLKGDLRPGKYTLRGLIAPRPLKPKEVAAVLKGAKGFHEVVRINTDVRIKR